MMMKNIIKNLSLVLSVLVVSVILSYGVLAWTEPLNPAPAGNVAAPINTGNATQIKYGGLNLGSLNVTGSVGIGTSSPAAKLDIAGGNIISEQIIYARHIDGKNWNNNDTVGDLYLQYNNSSNNTLINTRGGKVGIGTASPAEKLDVAGTAVANYLRIDPQDGTNEGGELQLAGSGSYNTFQIDNYQGNARIHTLASGKQFQVLGGTIYANGGGNNYFSGNVGIGTATPSQKLDVVGYVKGQTGLCIGNDCRTSWPSSGTGADQNCAAGSVVTGVKADGTIVCNTSGPTCKPKGQSCTTAADCCSNNCLNSVCETGSEIHPCNEKFTDRKKVFVTGPYAAWQLSSDKAANDFCKNAANDGTDYKALVYLGGEVPTNKIPANWEFWNAQKTTIGSTDCNWTRIAEHKLDFFTVDSSGNYLLAPILGTESGASMAGVTVWTNFKPNGTGGVELLSTATFGSTGTCHSTGYQPCAYDGFGKYTTDACFKFWCQTCNSSGGCGVGCRAQQAWYGNTSSKGLTWAYAVSLVNNDSCRTESRAIYCVQQ